MSMSRFCRLTSVRPKNLKRTDDDQTVYSTTRHHCLWQQVASLAHGYFGICASSFSNDSMLVRQSAGVICFYCNSIPLVDGCCLIHAIGFLGGAFSPVQFVFGSYHLPLVGWLIRQSFTTAETGFTKLDVSLPTMHRLLHLLFPPLYSFSTHAIWIHSSFTSFPIAFATIGVNNTVGGNRIGLAAL